MRPKIPVLQNPHPHYTYIQPAQLTKHLDKSTLSNPEGEGRVIPAQRFQALSRLEKTWAGFSGKGEGGRKRRGINPRGKEENTARRKRRRRWSYRSGSASRISLVWGVPCSIDIGRTPLPSLLSLPEERGGKPRGSGVNELKEEASSNQSSRDGFSLNVLRGNRVCYGGLSETIFFFLRGIWLELFRIRVRLIFFFFWGGKDSN